MAVYGPDKPRGSLPIERLAQHVAQAITVAGLLAVGTAIYQSNGTLARLTEKIDAMKEAAGGRSILVDRTLLDHETRIRAVERVR